MCLVLVEGQGLILRTWNGIPAAEAGYSGSCSRFSGRPAADSGMFPCILGYPGTRKVGTVYATMSRRGSVWGNINASSSRINDTMLAITAPRPHIDISSIV